MKQSLLVVVASAAIGAAAALYFSPPAQQSRPAPQPDVRTLQIAFERALESVGFGTQARATQAGGAPSEGAVGAPPVGARQPAGPAAEEERETPVLPPADRRVIESLRPFDEDETLRRTWLFRSERDVIAWLGTPDDVSLEAGGERWRYSNPDGTEVVAYFARGRLLNIYR